MMSKQWWRQRGASGVYLALSMSVGFLSSCQGAGQKPGAPLSYRVLDEGAGPGNDVALWVPSLGDRADGRVLDRTFRLDGEKVYVWSNRAALSVNLSELGPAYDSPTSSIWLARREQGIVIVGLQGQELTEAFLLIPKEVRNGMRWEGSLNGGTHTASVVRLDQETPFFGVSTRWEVSLEDPSGDQVMAMMFVEGYGPDGYSVVQFLDEVETQPTPAKIPTKPLERIYPDEDVLPLSLGSVRPEMDGSTFAQVELVANGISFGSSFRRCFEFDGASVSASTASSCVPDESRPELARVGDAGTVDSFTRDDFTLGVVPLPDGSTGSLSSLSNLHHMGIPVLAVEDARREQVLASFGDHLSTHTFFSLGMMTTLFRNGSFSWFAQRRDSDALSVFEVDASGRALAAQQVSYDSLTPFVSVGFGSGILSSSATPQERELFFSDLDGSVQRASIKDRTATVEKWGRFELPPGHQLVGAVPHREAGKVTWLLLTRVPPGEDPSEVGEGHFLVATTDDGPEHELDLGALSLRAAPLGLDVLICFDPKWGALEPDAEWTISGTRAKAVVPLREGSGCAVLVRDFEVAPFEPRDVDAYAIEGRAPDGRRVAINATLGVDSVVLDDAWKGHLNRLHDDFEHVAALEGGGHRTPRRLYDGVGIAVTTAPEGFYEDVQSTGGAGASGALKTAEVPGALWMVGPAIEEGTPVLRDHGLYRLTRQTEQITPSGMDVDVGQLASVPGGGVLCQIDGISSYVSSSGVIEPLSDLPPLADSSLAWSYRKDDGSLFCATTTGPGEALYCAERGGTLEVVSVPPEIERFRPEGFLPTGEWLLSAIYAPPQTSDPYQPGPSTFLFDPSVRSVRVLDDRVLIENSLHYAPDGSVWAVAYKEALPAPQIARIGVQITSNGFVEIDTTGFEEAVYDRGAPQWDSPHIYGVLPDEEMLLLAINKEGDFSPGVFLRVPRPDR